MRLDQCVSINRTSMPTHGHPHLCITRLSLSSLNLYFSFLSFDSTSLCGMHCRHHTIDLITNGPELKIAVDCFFWGAIQLTCESINPARVWQQFVPYRFGSAWRLFEPWQPFNKSSTVKSVNYKISADGTPNNMACHWRLHISSAGGVASSLTIIRTKAPGMSERKLGQVIYSLNRPMC